MFESIKCVWLQSIFSGMHPCDLRLSKSNEPGNGVKIDQEALSNFSRFANVNVISISSSVSPGIPIMKNPDTFTYFFAILIAGSI